MEARNKIRTISLFSGGGGLDIGFEEAGFDVLFANDILSDCCKTLEKNRGGTISAGCRVLCGDITTLDLSVLPDEVDMIIGGPPCQTFSASGRRAGGAPGRLDERGNLFQSYCKVVDHVKPKAFLFENVRGILATNKGRDFQNIVESFAVLGYRVEYRILDAEDYGVPQQRERLFIIGHKLDKPFLFPRPTYGPDSREQTPYVPVSKAIADLPFTEKDREETRFESGRYSHLLPLVPPGSNYLHFTAKRGYPEPVFAYRSRFSDFLYKADPDSPVKTLIASPGKYTGPLHWEDRYLTVAEYKRIQGFPDGHSFYGDRASQIRQIGNSVCPKLAYYMALAVREQIFGVPSGIEYLRQDQVLSFDKRKGEKAKRTKAIHAAVREKQDGAQAAFALKPFSCAVTPSASKRRENMTVQVPAPDTAEIAVHADDSGELQAELTLEVKDRQRDLTVRVAVYGQGEHGVQAMWNAVDVWVKECSSYNSLLELYGHFTEPHPVFRVTGFVRHTGLPIFKFAEQCMDFGNCSAYLPKERMNEMWGAPLGRGGFPALARRLQKYRFDIRSRETNVAIPQGVFMVAYPFTLPYDKQMNFLVKGGKRVPKKSEAARPEGLEEKIAAKLDEAYALAEELFERGPEAGPKPGPKDPLKELSKAVPEAIAQALSGEYIAALASVADKCEKASSGYLNLLTCTAIKAVYGEKVDVRYHQVQIQGATDRPAGFNFRGLSEGVIYDWMEKHEFHGAKSGWQTRTFERPKPYTLSYDENIGVIKEPFLVCFDQMETHGQDAFMGLVYLLWRRILLRQSAKIVLARPRTSDVLQIKALLHDHFFYQYRDSTGASRLPVLALYAVYSVFMDELRRYAGKSLKPLELHSAADARTGAIGDIEVVYEDGRAFEGVEVKHGLPITREIVDSVKQKIRGSQVERYYILTTSSREPAEEVREAVRDAEARLGCQIVTGNVLTSLEYYLRLLADPNAALCRYVDLLERDQTVKFEHRDVWNQTVVGKTGK